MWTTVLLIYGGLGVFIATALVSACALSGLISTGRMTASTRLQRCEVERGENGTTTAGRA